MSAAFTAAEVLSATSGTASGDLPARFEEVSTDSRAAGKGALFVALVGERFDGHQFLGAARAAGAAGALVARGRAAGAPADLPVIEVDDTLVALGRLARLNRRRFAIPVGAITGSNGKTTTKEMVGAILSCRGPALKTEGNLNNEVGVPLTLLRLGAAHRSAVVEMGMNHAGEIARLVAIAEPMAAAVTLVAPAHLAGLKTLDAVARAKGEIFRGLPADGVAVANADDGLVLREAQASGRRTMTFGRGPSADVRLLEIASHDASGLLVRIGFASREHRARLRFLGEHNALNACGAFAMGLALGCSVEQCVEGLEAARGRAHRLESLAAPGGVTVLDDCYNANPASVAAALDALVALAGSRRKVAVLGDMLELGPAEEAEHRRMGERALRAGVSLLVLFGPRSKAAWDAARALGDVAAHFPDASSAEGALEWLKERLAPGDLVLVKGSRGMRLERVVEGLAGVSGGGH